MPQFLERKLKAEAASKGMTGRRADRYTYGALNALGMMHDNKVTAKGERAQAKHERDMKAGPAEQLRRPHEHIHNLGKWAHPKRSMRG